MLAVSISFIMGPFMKTGSEESRHRSIGPCADAESWESEQLRSLLELAATRVPYYKKNWQKLDWKVSRFAC